jgi:succinylarginine dihydrolase
MQFEFYKSSKILLVTVNSDEFADISKPVPHVSTVTQEIEAERTRLTCEYGDCSVRLSVLPNLLQTVRRGTKPIRVS